MVNLKTTFQEFIQWIPTCRKDLSLESVVSKVIESPQGMIALVDFNCIPQGIIYSSHLLDFITRRSLSEKDEAIARDLKYWQAIVLPLSFLDYQMEIRDFLDRFPLKNQKYEQNYFIVDEEDKLLGILDIPKLLSRLLLVQNGHRTQKNKSLSQNYFSSTSNNSRQKDLLARRNDLPNKLSLADNSIPQKTTKNKNLARKNQTELQDKHHHLYSLLTQISLPLRIENSQGEVFFQNTHWNREIEPNQNLTQSLVNNRVSVRSWLSEKKNVRKQGLLKNEKSAFYCQYQPSNLATKISDRSFTNNHCPTVNNLSLVSSSSREIQQQVKQLNSSLFNQNLEQNYSTNILTLEDYEPEWYYYRLPLTIKSEDVTETNSPHYWLVVGTKLPLKQDLAVNHNWQHNQSKLKQLQNEFILNISHDLKSPLTAIIGLSSLLKEEKLGSLNKSQLRHSSMIYHSGKRLIDLINDFLDITRLTAGQLQLNLEPIELESTCQQIYERVKQKLTAITLVKEDEKMLFPELQLDIDSNARLAIADKTYFCQILTRLLENALQLTSSDQLLGIATECWSNWLAITVWNEGGGLSEAQQNFSGREFTRYENFLTSQERKQELGLALAQQLAQAHGGDISLISQINYGSEFTLLLPLKPQEFLDDSIAPIDSVEEQKTDNRLVLIVETSVTKIVDLSEQLKTLGYYCAIARNSTEALYKARCFQPWKIVLSSSLMANSELDIIQMLKSDERVSQIPLVTIAEIDSSSSDTAKSQDRTFLNLPSMHKVGSESLSFPLSKANLIKIFPPIKLQKPEKKQNLTVLRLSLTEEIDRTANNFALDYVFENISFSLSHHIIEADSLEQAHLLTRIWTIDVIIWDGATLESPETYLSSFAESNLLGNIPIITLDTKSTEAANQIDKLNVFPCLLPANERSINQLIQVIQIAAGLR